MPGNNRTIILSGGDRRELELYRRWKKRGVNVKAAGFAQIPEMEEASEQDCRDAAIFIAPLSGIDADGYVRAPFAGGKWALGTHLDGRAPGTILLTGSVAAPLKEKLAAQTTLIITGDDEELTLLNAIPTAEGALQKAMELSAVTLHGSDALIFGLGRCGRALAAALLGLGARVTAVVRRAENAALAYSMGAASCPLEEAGEAAGRADFIFNTAPAPLLTAALLKKVKKDTVILDLASSPGGTDFAAAARLGLQAVLLPGLPGRAAPKTASRILDKVYRRLIAETAGSKNIKRGS